ncbi:MAG: hypothetical protein EA360_07775 [Balneolaceae bacterium]|nr:MAG: hypothetical protein EA360_07775 [Balneolaceae bacterium]
MIPVKNYPKKADGRMSFLLLFLYFFQTVTAAGLAVSETDTLGSRFRSDLEHFIEMADPDLDESVYLQILELFEQLSEEKINPNQAGIHQLLELPGVTLRDAQNLIQEREKNGTFHSLSDLLRIDGFNERKLTLIAPFITFESALSKRNNPFSTLNRFLENGRFEAYSRYRQTLEQMEGYRRQAEEGGFIGSPVNYYQRFRYSSSHLSMNLTQAKRAGEPLPDLTQFDSASWHVALRNTGNLRMAVLGNYSVSFGQGLLLWNGGSFGKNMQTTGSISKNERGIQPLNSANAEAAFRGIALTAGKRLQVTGFYSSNNRTSVMHDDGSVNFPREGSYYRTVRERQQMKDLGQETFGGRVRLESRVGYWGVSAFLNRFERPIAQGQRPYHRFLFQGRNLSGFSTDYRFQAGPAHFFGEIAQTGRSGRAFLGGAGFSAGNSTDLILLYRNYQTGYQGIFGSSFSEQSGYPRNESGIYFGFSHRFSNRVLIRAFRDQFSFPGPRFQSDQPSAGSEWLLLTEYRPRRDLTIYALMRFKTREQETTGQDPFGREVRLLIPVSRNSMRIQAEKQINREIRIRSRIEILRSSPPNETGYLLFQDLRVQLRPNIRLDARVTLFDTDSFSSRVFQFENDLLYVMTNMMLHGQGQRIYLLLYASLFSWADIWIKAATTLYENRTAISSGLSEIHGNRKSDIGFQVRFRF